MPGAPEHHTPDQNVDEMSEQVSRQVSNNPDPSPGEPTDPGRHQLGPHVVGQRVVVRRLVPGVTGPTGGPAFTDVLGDCLAWDQASRTCVLQSADGTLHRIDVDLIVSGKPVPPRPSVRLRVSPAQAEAHVAALWPTQLVEVGGWTLRTTPPGPDGRRRKRGNSMLAVADVVDVAAASRSARAHYAALGLPALAATVPDSPAEGGLLALGWEPLAEGASALLTAPLSRVARRTRARGVGHPVHSEETDTRAHARVLAPSGRELAAGRATLTGDDWVGLEDLWVDPEVRRQGYAHAVLADLLDWAGSQGATTVWLHVELVHTAARELYAALGFSEHHRMRYLQAPAAPAPWA